MELRTIITGITVFALGCFAPVVAGRNEAQAQPPLGQRLRIDYVETLREQASLRGESFRINKQPASPAEAAVMLRRPTAVAADLFRVYVTDRYTEPALGSTARIFIFERSSQTVSIIRSDSSPTAAMYETRARLIDPFGIAVDAAGMIYVSDAQQGLVFGLDRLGARLLTVGRMGDLGYPVSVAVDAPRGRLYVADRQGGVVRAFTTRGERLFDLGVPDRKKGRLRMPVGVAVDRGGTCYVLEAGRKKVQVYDVNGRNVRSFPLTAGANSAGMKPAGIAVDSDGHVYVTDVFNNAIHIFDADGSYLQSLGRMGSNRDEFWSPLGIFIDSRDTIFIADEMNSRIQVYQYTK